MSELSIAWSGGPEVNGVATDYLDIGGANLLARWARHHGFWDARLAAGLDPYCRTAIERVGPECAALTRGQERIAGVNFASQDYLSLSSHPVVCAAAIEAIGQWGVHSAGSAATQGATAPLITLEERLADILNCRDVTIFPTGWAAGYGAVRALARRNDHIVIDAAAHASLRDGAANATANVSLVPNCSIDAIAECLAHIRENDARNGVLVITAALFSMDSTVPDLRALRSVCQRHEATLLVDVAHDFGAIGNGGLGFLGDCGLTGEVDLIVGSFSKCFASNGGFVASSAPGIRQALRVFSEPLLFSNALSPVQAAIVNAALTVARSREGAERRSRLMHNAVRLRDALTARAFRVLGQPSPVVPVWLGDIAEARLITRAILANGALVNLVEPPSVARQNTRWRLQVMADHTEARIDRFVAAAVAARERAWPRPSPARPHPVAGPEQESTGGVVGEMPATSPNLKQ